jgi:hypothetical protein
MIQSWFLISYLCCSRKKVSLWMTQRWKLLIIFCYIVCAYSIHQTDIWFHWRLMDLINICFYNTLFDWNYVMWLEHIKRNNIKGLQFVEELKYSLTFTESYCSLTWSIDNADTFLITHCICWSHLTKCKDKNLSIIKYYKPEMCVFVLQICLCYYFD